MAEGAGRERWSRISSLLALIANVNRDPKRHRAFTPADFDPYMQRGRKTRVSVKELKAMFVGRGKKGRAKREPSA